VFRKNNMLIYIQKPVCHWQQSYGKYSIHSKETCLKTKIMDRSR